MPDPSWLGYSFGVALMVVGAYCVARLVAAAPMGRQNHYDVNVAHVLMALAMVGMLVPGWNIVPVGLGETVFALMALWFLGKGIRLALVHGRGVLRGGHASHLRHYLIHMVMACSMLYMYWLGMPVTQATSGATMSGSAMPGPPADAGDPGLTLLLTLTLLASAVWQLDSISRFSGARAPALVMSDGTSGLEAVEPAERPWLAPRLEVGCHVAMCIVMAYVLVLMV